MRKQLLAQTTLGIGLLLVGWGLDAPAAFFAHPARAALIALSLLSAALAQVWRLDIQVFRKGKQPVGHQRWLMAGLMLVAFSLIGFLAYADRRSLLTFADAEATRYVGVLLCAGGNGIGLVALRSLGKHYSAYVTLQEDHRLVQAGVYGVIRHPIYLRALLVAVGFPLVFRSWLVFPVFALLAVFVTVRIRQEEKLLAEHFGAEFEAYRSRTWRLVPHLF